MSDTRPPLDVDPEACPECGDKWYTHSHAAAYQPTGPDDLAGLLRDALNDLHIEGNMTNLAYGRAIAEYIGRRGVTLTGVRSFEVGGLREAVMVPTALIRTEWPPNPDLTPGGSPRFHAVYDSLAAGDPIREPIRVRYDNWTVIDGCHRLQSARLLGIALVPVRFWTGREWLPAALTGDTGPQETDRE